MDLFLTYKAPLCQLFVQLGGTAVNTHSLKEQNVGQDHTETSRSAGLTLCF